MEAGFKVVVYIVGRGVYGDGEERIWYAQLDADRVSV